jgi:hypothetical protein
MRVEYERISLVLVIAVFTKYEQFRRNVKYLLEDQGIDTSTDAVFLNAEVEKTFKEQYLAKLPVHTPAVRLESENCITTS